jgi:hypothetical protein
MYSESSAHGDYTEAISSPRMMVLGKTMSFWTALITVTMTSCSSGALGARVRQPGRFCAWRPSEYVRQPDSLSAARAAAWRCLLVMIGVLLPASLRVRESSLAAALRPFSSPAWRAWQGIAAAWWSCCVRAPSVRS